MSEKTCEETWFGVLESLCEMVSQHVCRVDLKLAESGFGSDEGAVWALKELDLITDEGKVDFEALRRRRWMSYSEGSCNVEKVTYSEPSEGESFGPGLDAPALDTALRKLYTGERIGNTVYCLDTDAWKKAMKEQKK